MDDSLHLILANASLVHRKRCRQCFQEMNLSEGQPKVLSSLLSNEGIVQRQLAAICCVEPATMTSLLRKMESDGLVTKRQSIVSGGKRANCIFLTEAGREIALAVDKVMSDTEELAFKGFSQKEQELFYELIGRLTDNLS